MCVLPPRRLVNSQIYKSPGLSIVLLKVRASEDSSLPQRACCLGELATSHGCWEPIQSRLPEYHTDSPDGCHLLCFFKGRVKGSGSSGGLLGASERMWTHTAFLSFRATGLLPVCSAPTGGVTALLCLKSWPDASMCHFDLQWFSPVGRDPFDKPLSPKYVHHDS